MNARLLDQALNIWWSKFGRRPKEIERVAQLNAETVYNGIVFSLFFYFQDESPRWVIACVTRCD